MEDAATVPLSPVFPTNTIIKLLPFFSSVTTIDRYRTLKRKKYALHDVKADGNCGIYAIIISRIINHSTNARILSVDLPKLVVETRKALHSTMSTVGKEIVTANKSKPDFKLLFDINQTDWDEVLTSFYDASLSEDEYMHIGAQRRHHVFKSWIALIAVITYRMQVIQYLSLIHI